MLEEKKVYFGFVTGVIGFFLGGYMDVLVGEMLFWLLLIPSTVFIVVLFLETLKESLRTYLLMSVGGFLIGLLAGMMVL